MDRFEEDINGGAISSSQQLLLESIRLPGESQDSEIYFSASCDNRQSPHASLVSGFSSECDDGNSPDSFAFREINLDKAGEVPPHVEQPVETSDAGTRRPLPLEEDTGFRKRMVSKFGDVDLGLVSKDNGVKSTAASAVRSSADENAGVRASMDCPAYSAVRGIPEVDGKQYKSSLIQEDFKFLLSKEVLTDKHLDNAEKIKPVSNSAGLVNPKQQGINLGISKRRGKGSGYSKSMRGFLGKVSNEDQCIRRNSPSMSNSGDRDAVSRSQKHTTNQQGVDIGFSESKLKKQRSIEKSHIPLEQEGITSSKIANARVIKGKKSMPREIITKSKTTVLEHSSTTSAELNPGKIYSQKSSPGASCQTPELCVVRSEDLQVKPHSLSVNSTATENVFRIEHSQTNMYGRWEEAICSINTEEPIENLDKLNHSSGSGSEFSPRKPSTSIQVNLTKSDQGLQHSEELPVFTQQSLAEASGANLRAESSLQDKEEVVSSGKNILSGKEVRTRRSHIPIKKVACLPLSVKTSKMESIVQNGMVSPVADSGDELKKIQSEKMAAAHSGPKEIPRFPSTFLEAVNVLTIKSDHSIGNEPMLEVMRRAGYTFPKPGWTRSEDIQNR